MELLEISADDIASSDHDEDCYFCSSKDKPGPLTNDLADDCEDDSQGAIQALEVDVIKFKNDSSKLGTALGGNPGIKKTKSGTALDVSAAAHHLIPGNAALKKSVAIMEYIGVNGEKAGNVGYNVNSAPNGVWLPGNYAMRPWGPGGVKFHTNTGIEPETYAFRAIEAWEKQFHDAHEDYSSFVLGALDKIAEKLKHGEDVVCPEQKSKPRNPEERPPLQVVVSRLNQLSGRMRRMLVFPTVNWRVNVWTSGFTLRYMHTIGGKK